MANLTGLGRDIKPETLEEHALTLLVWYTPCYDATLLYNKYYLYYSSQRPSRSTRSRCLSCARLAVMLLYCTILLYTNQASDHRGARAHAACLAMHGVGLWAQTEQNRRGSFGGCRAVHPAPPAPSAWWRLGVWVAGGAGLNNAQVAPGCRLPGLGDAFTFLGPHYTNFSSCGKIVLWTRASMRTLHVQGTLRQARIRHKRVLTYSTLGKESAPTR